MPLEVHKAREDARTMSIGEFAARYSQRYLIVAEAADDLPTPFRTIVARAAALPLRPADRFIIVAIEKTGANPFADRISIGRARNCDIILRHPSVSKLHAHLRAGEPLQLVDVGSVNGTRVNGRRIEQDRSVPLRVNDTLQFGTLQALLVDGFALFELLQ